MPEREPPRPAPGRDGPSSEARRSAPVAVDRGLASNRALLRLQRTAGNAATVAATSGRSPARAEPRVIRRMATPYTFTDHGVEEPGVVAGWLEETIVSVRYQRPGIEAGAKAAVVAFGDNAAAGTYKHYVPSVAITDALIGRLTAGLTRGQAIGDLDTICGTLVIPDASGLEPQKNRVEFDAWFSWMIDAIADWPSNIYRWDPSGGDGAGTRVDTPQNSLVAAVPPALTARLAAAATALNGLLGTPT